MGYVGTVSAACFAELGHDVIGVDVNPRKLEMLNRGLSPMVEEGIDEAVRAGIDAGPLRVGSGTRIKIYEAMAMRRPVVSTTIGAEGLPLEAGAHLPPGGSSAGIRRRDLRLARLSRGWSRAGG